MNIQAIETVYKGYRFRSRLEARWAVFFDEIGVKWEYEKEGYELDSGRYLPDFYLPDFKFWIEVKGEKKIMEMDKLSELAKSTGENCFMVEGQVGQHTWLTDYYQSPLPFSKPVVREGGNDLLLKNFIPSDRTLDAFGAKKLCCPICGFDYVHFGTPKHIDGKDSYKAWEGRGDAILIDMDAECGDSWTLQIGFHKGFTFLSILDTATGSTDVGLYLCNWNEDKYRSAIKKARSARFEFGESG